MRIRGRRFTNMLAFSTLATYLVIILGSTIAITNFGSACSTWPMCNGKLIAVDSPSLAVAWGYRVLVLFTGIVVAATGVASWFSGVPRRVKAALAGVVLLYPIEVSIGAFLATGRFDFPLSSPAIHLAVAVTIFTALLAALTWTLEHFEEAEGGSASKEATEKSTGDSAQSPDETPQQTPTPEDTVSPGSRSTFDVVKSRASAYLELTKPKLMWLLCLVALAAMGLAAGSKGRSLEAETVVATLLGGVLSIGASGTFNNVIERDRDRKMNRTSDRPLVEDQVPVRNAVVFGFALSVASIGVFAYFVNILAAALGVVAILFYSVIYTIVLKPNTTQNIVLGGAVGALPALIGWAAVRNEIGIPAIVLGTVIFLWTPAHFYNLALAYKDDYERGGFPMLPVVRGDKITRRHILLYLGATLISASVLGGITSVGWVYALSSTAVGAVFVWAVIKLYREKTNSAALRAFHASNAYLGTLLIAIVVDTLII